MVTKKQKTERREGSGSAGSEDKGGDHKLRPVGELWCWKKQGSRLPPRTCRRNVTWHIHFRLLASTLRELNLCYFKPLFVIICYRNHKTLMHPLIGPTTCPPIKYLCCRVTLAVLSRKSRRLKQDIRVCLVQLTVSFLVGVFQVGRWLSWM